MTEQDTHTLTRGRFELKTTIDPSGVVTVKRKNTPIDETLYTGRIMEAELVGAALMDVFKDD